MAITGEKSKPLDLESAAAEQSAEQSQDEIRSAAQTDKVVRGVNGSLTPKARKLRPLAGIILIALVVLAAAYMRHGLASRNNKTRKQTETAQVGSGPATTVEKGMLSDQARNGLDIGQSTFRNLHNAPPLQPATLQLAGHLCRLAQGQRKPGQLDPTA
jgi:hypothetical protein